MTTALTVARDKCVTSATTTVTTTPTVEVAGREGRGPTVDQTVITLLLSARGRLMDGKVVTDTSINPLCRYPDTFNCAKYWHCSAEQGEHFMCDTGLVYEASKVSRSHRGHF